MPRGGRRAGAPGKTYGNRSDLNTNRTLPVQTAPNQSYGVAGQQAAAQRVVPLASQPAPAGNAGASQSPLVPQASPAGAPPQLVPLDAPTMRPNEPLTAGVNTGPGPGAPPVTTAPSTVGDLLRSVAPSSPELAELYDYLSGGGQ